MVAFEFGKLAPGTWLPVKVMTGAGAVGALVLICFLFGHGSRGGMLDDEAYRVRLSFGPAAAG